MPLPEYHRLLGSLFCTFTATTLGVLPSVCTVPVSGTRKPV